MCETEDASPTTLECYAIHKSMISTVVYMEFSMYVIELLSENKDLNQILFR